MQSRWGLVATVAAIGALGACVKIPAFQGDGSGSGSGSGNGDGGGSDGGDTDHCPASSTDITHFGDPAHPLVCGDGFAMRFSPEGAGLPASLVVGGHEVLGTGSGCIDENAVGLGHAPAAMIDGESSAMAQTHGSRLASVSHAGGFEIAEPFLTKHVTTWNASLDCGPTFSGRETWTVFPKGRLVRYDHLERQGHLTDGDTCEASCVTNPTWYPKTYVSLADDGTAQLNGAMRPTTIGDSNSYDGAVCFDNASTNVHVGLKQMGMLLYIKRVSATIISFSRDLGSTGQLDDAAFESTSIVSLSASANCNKSALDFYGDSGDHLVVDAGGTIAMGYDGIYGGDTGGSVGGIAGFSVANDPVGLHAPTSTTMVPANWAVALKFTSPHANGFTITRSDIVLTALQAGYAEIGTTHDLFVFWFAEQLLESPSVVITPN